ncbi:hypothetical protein GCM10010302_05830 [Streptomyces polychromogenes]|uniref:Uncharacterized protein n=2 Tax=Streptomyces TaxID=1883 RepID=A0ABN0V200_9ACTN
MLAQAAESVLGPAALRAGVAYEQKPDGQRALLFTPAMLGKIHCGRPSGRGVTAGRPGRLQFAITTHTAGVPT